MLIVLRVSIKPFLLKREWLYCFFGISRARCVQARFLAGILYKSVTMEAHKLSVPYKNDQYDVDVAIEHRPHQCRIRAKVVGHELMFVSADGGCLRAVYRENIIADGLINEIAKVICSKCLK